MRRSRPVSTTSWKIFHMVSQLYSARIETQFIELRYLPSSDLWLARRVTNIEVKSRDKVGVLSDHDAITFNLDFSSRIPNDNRQIKFNFKRADFTGLRKALLDDPFENYLNEDNTIEDDWAAWKSVLFSEINCYIPKLKPRKFVTPLWIDGEVNHAIRKKNSLLTKAKQKDNDCL